MKKSELKQLIREVIEEIESISSLNLSADILNISPEIMNMSVSAMKNYAPKINKNLQHFELIDLQQALTRGARSSQIKHEKAPLDIYNKFKTNEKKEQFLDALKWWARNETQG